MTIEIYQDGDADVWIPVAKPSSKFPPRAFLPFKGKSDTYKHGYKAEMESSTYLTALVSIQKAYLNKETKVFLVNHGKKEEKQRKDAWRHGPMSDAPGVSPTLGWVKVPMDELDAVSGKTLGEALSDSISSYAIIPRSTKFLNPEICSTEEELELKVFELVSLGLEGVPVGQSNPEKINGQTSSFKRDAQVVCYVRRIANGMCECCNLPAPFKNHNDVPFLEVHHVKTLADGGTDRVTNAIAICPNCHREFHHGKQGSKLTSDIYLQVARLIKE